MGRGRITIGLYNSYDQNFREPHRRVIARAGDLARAYDMGLALFGFPIPEDARTPREIAEWVAGTTSIGGHGKNFLEMAETGRFQCFPYPGKGFPPQLGEVILTTSKPDAKKQISLSEAVSMVEHGLGFSILSELVLQGRQDNVRSLPLDPPACRRIGIAVQSLEEAAPAVGEFIRYSRRIVAELHQ